MTVRVLGPVTATLSDRTVEIPGDKPRLVLALLASRAGTIASVEYLIDGLWGEEPPETARKSLQVHVSNLRKALGVQTVLTEANGYRLVTDIDAGRFESAIADGLNSLSGDPAAAIDHLDEALGWWRGVPYSGFLDVPDLAADSTRLSELMLQGLEARFEAMLGLSRHPEVLAGIDSLIAENPYREGLRGLKMRALYRAGRQAEALGVYQETRHLLADELGIDPSRELQDLEQRLLEQDPSLDAPDRIEVTSVNLPARRGDLIGRDQDLTTVKETLSGHRLVTLTGVGGCGKTRLAIEVGHQAMDQFEDGVTFVDLTRAVDDRDVLTAVISAIGLTTPPGVDDMDHMIRFLANRHALFVLDNCEHVLEGVCETVDAVLDGCPTITILATSREALSLPGELAWRVPSLTVDGAASSAVDLFVTRAAEADPGFTMTPDNTEDVVEICRRLDGIPLALELAAARISVMTVDDIRRRLDDRFRLLTGGGRRTAQRQQTLQGAVEWSYDLLTEQEKTMLRRLSVFAGSFDLADVPAVSGFDENTTADLLQSLTNKSMVTFTTSTEGKRGRLLETIRLFAVDRLVDAGEAADTRNLHFDTFVNAFDGMSLTSVSYDPVIHARLNRDLDNIVAAIDWGQETGRRAESALMTSRVSGILYWQGSLERYIDLLEHDYELGPADHALLLCGRAMVGYLLRTPRADIVAREAREIVSDEVLDDVFLPQLSEMDLAPGEGAETRLQRLDEMLVLAARSPSADRNTGAIQYRRAGQLYSLGRLEEALEATSIACPLLDHEYAMTLSCLALQVYLGKRGEAFTRREQVQDFMLGRIATSRAMQRDEFEQDIYAGVCEIGNGRPQEAGTNLARSASRHVRGLSYIDEGDYLQVFAGLRAEIGDYERARLILTRTPLSTGTIEWLTWPYVWGWERESFAESNRVARRQQLDEMTGNRATEFIADLMSEEIEFWTSNSG